MDTLIVAIHVLVSIFLVVVILLQVGKGASIGSSFGATSSQAIFGSTGPTSFLAKITIACAVVFMLTSLYLTYLSGLKEDSSLIQDVPVVETTPAPQQEEKAPEPR